jgi:hypothetical protein
MSWKAIEYKKMGGSEVLRNVVQCLKRKHNGMILGTSEFSGLGNAEARRIAGALWLLCNKMNMSSDSSVKRKMKGMKL